MAVFILISILYFFVVSLISSKNEYVIFKRVHMDSISLPRVFFESTKCSLSLLISPYLCFMNCTYNCTYRVIIQLNLIMLKVSFKLASIISI